MTTIRCEAKMWRKLLLSAFLAVLCAQGIDGVPAPSTGDNESSPNEIQHSGTVSKRRGFDELPGRKYLRHAAYKNMTSLLDFQLLSTYKIAKDVLADPAITSVDTENMRYERTQLGNYVKEAKVAADEQLPADKTDRQSYFFSTMGKGFILEHFDGYARNRNVSQSLRELNDEQRIVWATLLRHGYGEHHQEAERRGELFAINLANAVLQYVDSLNPAEKENEADLVKLCQEYERHRSHENKVKFGSDLSDVLLAYEEK